MNKELQNYNKAVALIKEHSDLLYPIQSCSLETVKKAEKILNILFPYTYKMCLQTFGILRFEGQDVCGIAFDDINKSDMLEKTISEQKKYGMSKDLVIIHDTEMDGERYCLKINKENPDLSPVVSYFNPEWPTPVLWENFGTFLLDLVEHEIKNQESFNNEESH